MTHGLGPGKPGPRAAKPITPPYVENSYRIEVKITFMLIAYLVLPWSFFWELLIFHFCRPQVDIYWHPLLGVLLGVAKSIVGLLLFLVWVLFSGFSILCIYVRWLHLSATPRNYSETQLIRSPMGQKRLAILTGLPYEWGFFFYKKMYSGFWQAAIVTR